MKIRHEGAPSIARREPTPEARKLAQACYSTAKGYVQGAYLVVCNRDRLQLPDDSSLVLSVHMLCGFAIELYLKAALAHYGENE